MSGTPDTRRNCHTRLEEIVCYPEAYQEVAVYAPTATQVASDIFPERKLSLARPKGSDEGGIGWWCGYLLLARVRCCTQRFAEAIKIVSICQMRIQRLRTVSNLPRFLCLGPAPPILFPRPEVIVSRVMVSVGP